MGPVDWLRLFKALHHHRRGIGNFFPGLQQYPLADQLSDQEALGLIGELILGEVSLAL